MSKNKYEKFIEDELEKTLKEGNKDVIEHLYSWILEQWKTLSTTIKNQRIAIDICKEYQEFAGYNNTEPRKPGEQEVIECKGNSILIPLHELFDKETKNRLNVGMIISFDNNTHFC